MYTPASKKNTKNKGYSPFGKDFNTRESSYSIKDMVSLCINRVPKKDMPLMVGVGDTVTSSYVDLKSGYMRGGSDRSFLTLIQEIGIL